MAMGNFCYIQSIECPYATLWKERNINWNDFPTDCKRGSCCIKTRITEAVSVLNGDATVEVSRSRWVVDREPPVFTQDREYVERRL